MFTYRPGGQKVLDLTSQLRGPSRGETRFCFELLFLQTEATGAFSCLCQPGLRQPRARPRSADGVQSRGPRLLSEGARLSRGES